MYATYTAIAGLSFGVSSLERVLLIEPVRKLQALCMQLLAGIYNLRKFFFQPEIGSFP